MILRTRKKKWSRYLKPKTFMSRLVLGCPMLNDMENWWKEQYVHITWSEWVSESHSVVSDSLRPHGLYSPWNSPGQNIGVGSLSLLQGIFMTQGLDPGLSHCGINSLVLILFYGQTLTSYWTTGLTWLLEKPSLWLEGLLLVKEYLCFLICCLGMSLLFFQGASVF